MRSVATGSISARARRRSSRPTARAGTRSWDASRSGSGRRRSSGIIACGMPLRSDVVGSLLRPTYLLEARTAIESGRLGGPEFKRVEDRAVDEAVRLQEAAGLDVVSDGEMRRYAFFGHMIEALAGFDKHGGWAIPFRDERGEQLVFKRPVVVDKLAWRRSMCGEEFAYLRARANRPTKV